MAPQPEAAQVATPLLRLAMQVWALPDRAGSALDDVPEDERVGATLEGGPSPRGEDAALVLGSPKGEVSD